MKINQVAAILYTLRDYCKKPADVATTLKKVREIGYEAVQVSGICEVPEDDLNKMLADNGLTCCATHEQGPRIINEPEAIIERLDKLNCKLTAYPYPAGIDFTSEESIEGLIKGLNAAGEKFTAAGKTLMYHNHGIEFIPYKGTSLLEYIYDTTDPKFLQGEPDTYWVQFGGGNPEAFCKKLTGRLPALHMKDYTFKADPQGPVYTEIGNGNLDFKAICAAAEAAGCQWYIVEQDTTPGSPFDSLKQSFDYIKANLVEA